MANPPGFTGFTGFIDFADAPNRVLHARPGRTPRNLISRMIEMNQIQ